MTPGDPRHFSSVYLNATGAYYPGEPVGNERIDEYVAPINGASARIKRSILADVEDMQGHVVTVHVRQGHYADDGADGPAPDWTFDRIGDLLMFDPASFLSA